MVPQCPQQGLVGTEPVKQESLSFVQPLLFLPGVVGLWLYLYLYLYL